MNRMLRPFIAGGVIAAAAATAAGCADNNSTLFVYGVLATKAPDCSVTADPGSMMFGDGSLDVAIGSGYWAWLLVGNQYSPRGAKQQLKTETTRVTLTGAEVTLTSASTGQVITCPSTKNCGGPFSVYGSGFASSSKSEDPGWGAIEVQLLPDAVSAFFRTDPSSPIGKPGEARTTIVASVRVYGKTLGGQDVESGAFTYPIQVCNGCSILYGDYDLVTEQCLSKAGMTPVLPCRVGQDSSIPCSSCVGIPICRCPYTMLADGTCPP
jgi:hypothetical protein